MMQASIPTQSFYVNGLLLFMLCGLTAIGDQQDSCLIFKINALSCWCFKKMMIKGSLVEKLPMYERLKNCEGTVK